MPWEGLKVSVRDSGAEWDSGVINKEIVERFAIRPSRSDC